MTLTRDLCDIIAKTNFVSLGAECVYRVKQAIADGLAVAAAGTRQEPARIAADHVRSLGGRRQATVWGRGFKTSTVQAAFVNGVATHVLDFEPMWLPPTHSVSPTVPVAFALAEALGAGGREVLAAVAKGMEIQGRLQFAANQYKPGSLSFHPPGIVGVMGAAVTAGHMLQLDRNRLVYALGIAGSRAGALLANIGSMTKSTHCGQAAAAGLDAALLAERGFTASVDILDAPRGFITTFFPHEFEREKLLAYGKPFRVVDPGLAIKLFPSQFATHWAITAALELHPKIGDPRKISRVTIRGPVMDYINRPKPENGLDGKFSFQYTAAAALLDGRVGIDSFTDARRFRSDMTTLLEKVEFVPDPKIPGEWRGMRVIIEVKTRNGERFEAQCHAPRGAWGEPALTREEHAEKLRNCLGLLLDSRRAARLVALVDELEKQPAKGVRSIVSLLSSGGRVRPQSASKKKSRRAKPKTRVI